MENTTASPYVIEVDHVSMCFHMTKEKIDNLKEYLIRVLRRQLAYEEFWALRDVSFQVKRGEMVGVIGLNGAGKSTLLKIIAGIFKPTSGTVTVRGSVAPLLELGAGFDKDLTARDNVFLNGAMLGHAKEFMEEKYGEIIEFAELEDFQDVALKNFSSGMRARLGFAIATMVRPDILIADEILSVGDFKFRKKCLARIQSMIQDGTTVLLVSHSLNTVREECQEAVWLDKGSVVLCGPAQEVCERYENS